MRSFLLPCLILLVGTNAQGPVLQSCSWRPVPLEVFGQQFTFAEVICKFDQALFVTNISSGQLVQVTSLTGLKEVSDGNGNTNSVPDVSYYLGHIGKLTCGGKSYSGEQVLMGPSTNTAFLSFLGTFFRISIPSTPAADSLMFFVPLYEFTGGANTATVILPADMDACASAGTLTLEYGFDTVAQCQAASYPVSACDIKNAAGVAAVRSQTATLGPASLNPDCLPSAVNETATLMNNVLDQMLPTLTSTSQLSSIDLIMSAFASEKSLQACNKFAGSLMSLANVTRDVGTSRDCPFDYQTERAQYDKDPCCNWFSTKCCVPKSVTRVFQTVSTVNFGIVDTQCAANVPAALGNLRLIAQDINARAAETFFGYGKVYEDYSTLREPVSTCVSDVYYSSQECTKNGDCWSENCDMSNAQTNSGKGRCQVSEKPYVDFLKCLFTDTGLRRDIAAQFARDLGVTAATVAGKVNEAVSFLEATRQIRDCVGDYAWSYKARIDIDFGSDGSITETVIPANETGCLQRQRCNYGWGLSQSECLGNPALGTTANFCAQCWGSYCSEYSEWSECTLGGYGATDNQTCISYGGELTQRSPRSWRSPTCQNRSATSAETCIDFSVCPGPNSQSSYYSQYYASACSSSFCYVSNATDYSSCWSIPGSFYYYSDFANGNGLCLSFSESQQNCLAAGYSYYPGTRWRQGKYDTQATCEAPKCKLPNEYFLRDLNQSTCLASTACDQTCEKCVSGYSYSGNQVAQEYCFFEPISSSQCPGETDREYKYVPGGTSGYVCQLEGLSQADCTAQNGTYATCAGFSKATCSRDTVQKSAMECRWDENAKCTDAECLAAGKGECNDWYLKDYGCSNSATCGRCVVSFPLVPGTDIVNASYSACRGMTTFTDYVGIGCGAPWNSPLNADPTACANAGGTFKTQATNQQECESETACLRWGFAEYKMPQAACTECQNAGESAQWGSYYTWTTPSLVPGQVINLRWQPRAYETTNKMITTVPQASVVNFADSAIMKVLGRSYAASLRKQYSGQILAWARLACNCLAASATTLDNTVCTDLANRPVSIVTDICNCDATGTCDEICPFLCAGECSYNVTRYLAAGYLNQNVLSRRRLQGSGAGYAIYETVTNAAGEIIGQTVGDANRYAGLTVGDMINLCLNVDSFIEQSPAYTIYDFAPGDGANGAPGRPLMLNLVNNGGRICANVTVQTYPYWPIKRLPPGGTRSPTMPTTRRPAAPTASSANRIFGVFASITWAAVVLLM